MHISVYLIGNNCVSCDLCNEWKNINIKDALGRIRGKVTPASAVEAVSKCSFTASVLEATRDSIGITRERRRQKHKQSAVIVRSLPQLLIKSLTDFLTYDSLNSRWLRFPSSHLNNLKLLESVKGEFERVKSRISHDDKNLQENRSQIRSALELAKKYSVECAGGLLP